VEVTDCVALSGFTFTRHERRGLSGGAPQGGAGRSSLRTRKQTGVLSPAISPVHRDPWSLGDYLPSIPQLAGRKNLLVKSQHVGRVLPLRQPHDVGRHGLHYCFVLGLISMAVVDVGDSTFSVIGDAVHGVAAEAERRHL
jgi:hypothetical protein